MRRENLETKPKISVVIPVYNAENYVLTALHSVCFQTCRDLEIICVLDAPTDRSETIVRKCAEHDPRIRIIWNPQNVGSAEARNIGVRKALGEYIHFMDSDDLLNPCFYEQMMAVAAMNDADVAVSSVFNEKKPKQSIWFRESEIFTGSDKMTKTSVLIQGWIWRYLIRKNFWDNRQFLFPNLIVQEDTVVAIPMLYEANCVVSCPQAVYFYKNRGNSMLNRKRDPEQKKIWNTNLRNARKIKLEFIRKHDIQHHGKLYRGLLAITTKRPVCANEPVEYGANGQKISVILPIYNAEKYLGETINSIRFQTYRNLEIVCVLDKPTDRSADVVIRMADADERIKVVAHEKNMGLPAARNTGIVHATGKYIHFMDADDLLSPDFYDTLVSAAEKADADVTACSVYYEKKPWRSIWFSKTKVLSTKKDKIKKTEVTIQGWAWRYLIRKKFWDDRKFSFPNLVPMEDMPVMIPMIYQARKVVICANAVYFYKNRENSILNKVYDATREQLRSENRKKARKIFHDFMQNHHISRPNKILYYIRKYFS